MTSIQVHPEVTHALREGRAVVALETAVATAGLPFTPLGRAPACGAPGWDAKRPTNLEAARLLDRTARDAGVVPAMVGVVDGVLRIGMDDATLVRLVDQADGAKASARDLAVLLGQGGTAGATVSATMLACKTPKAGVIRVMATGGIGGVHRGWTSRPDVSEDLKQLASTQVCVVASGAKSVLDATATAEVMEALGIPVIAFAATHLPQFLTRGRADLPAPQRCEDVQAVARICITHWDTLGCGTGVLLANPVPHEHALDPSGLDELVQDADRQAQSRGITGPARTPHLLRAVMEHGGDAALDANIALLEGNTRLAAQVAKSIAEGISS